MRTLYYATASLLAVCGPLLLIGSLPAAAQAQPALSLTLDEALQIALVRNYTVRNLRLDVENAEAQVREAWGQVLPQVSASSSYTRNVKSPNPFAGSDAGGLFGSLGFVDWLAYNERARTDENPTSVPISFDRYIDSLRIGQDRAGITQNSSDNPFAVPNNFAAGISVEQTLFNGSAFAAIKGAAALREINARAASRQEQLLVEDVKQAYYQTLLASQQASVAQQSVARTQQTVAEVSRQVTQGVTPKAQRLSAEVQLANLETQLMQVDNASSLALDNLKLLLGIPIAQPILLQGDLQAENAAAYLSVSEEDAVLTAIRNRPDLEQARLAVKLNEVNANITRAEFLPTVSAFLNMNYIGNVPDNRTRTFRIDDPATDFAYDSENIGFFSKNYWNPSVSAGIRLSWNLFNGFQSAARLQQRQIAVKQAEINAEQALQAVHLEVSSALKNLRTARQRILAQEQNVARAELSYRFANARLSEGVASQLEERDASEQLDQSRLNYLQAIYDFVVAKTSFETAIGAPIAEPSSLRLTSN